MVVWTGADLRRAKEILRKYSVGRFRDAVEEIQRVIGRDVTAHALRSVFLRHELGPPSTYCAEDDESDEQDRMSPNASGPNNAADEEDDDEGEDDNGFDPGSPLHKLVQVSRRGPVVFADLCDKLDLSPSKTRGLIEQAKEMGIRLHVENNHVGIRSAQPEERVRQVGIAPVIGERQKVGVISDTHLGSKYCMREQLKEFVHYAYEQGVREILHPGDVLDGMYRHGVFEVSHVGLDDQARDLFETLPQLPGLNYRAITGNHDFTFTENSGVDVGHFLTGYFRKRGRNDLHFYGNRGAFLKVKGAIVHLWHPRSGVSYARSYALQKHVEKYASGEKPNILLAGHWHVYCHVYERGVHAVACPTFQGGGSAFSKSLGGAPAIGGMILSWDLTSHGTLRSFIHEYRAYFEMEKPQIIEDDTAYREEIPVSRGGK
jgi:predicted phosphodiesterase